MKEGKVDIKELGFTEQLLYGNDIKDNRIKELEEENKRLSEKNKIYSNALVQEKEENRKLKSEIENMKEVGRENIETLDRMSIELENYSKSFKRYRDFSKQELADSLYDAEEQNKKLKDNVAWYEKEEDRLREENKKLNELIFDINNQFETYREKMVDIEQELKKFLYKD